MATVSVTDLKARLSEHLRRVKAGEQLVITERNRPIATVTAIGLGDSSEADQAHIERLIAEGKLLPPRSSEPLPDSFWDTRGPPDPNSETLKGLLEERRSGW